MSWLRQYVNHSNSHTHTGLSITWPIHWASLAKYVGDVCYPDQGHDIMCKTVWWFKGHEVCMCAHFVMTGFTNVMRSWDDCAFNARKLEFVVLYMLAVVLLLFFVAATCLHSHKDTYYSYLTTWRRIRACKNARSIRQRECTDRWFVARFAKVATAAAVRG